MDKLRNYKGKHLSSFVRNKDFALTGEEEEINLMMHKFPQDPNQLILNVGCGLGGAANFMQNHGWGKVIGIDAEPESIDYAKTHYHGIDFHVCDVADIDKLFTIALFDIVSLFNVYYSLNNPRHTLHALHKVTKQGGYIAILDYLDRCENQLNPLFQDGDSKTKAFHPIKKSEIEHLLSLTGWSDPEIIDICDKYVVWYKNLLNQLEAGKDEIVQRFDQQAYDQYHDTYNKILEAIQKGFLGGVIIYARK